MVLVALYIFGGFYLYNSIVGLIFHCAFWLAIGNDVYFRKLNVYELFKAASWGNDRTKFSKQSKTIFGLEVFSAALIPGTLSPLSIVTYCIDDIQTRIGKLIWSYIMI